MSSLLFAPTSTLTRSQVAQAFERACLAELDAIKPGNVGRHGDGHRMQCVDFETSAAVASRWIAAPDASVGQRIVNAVDATLAAVGQNTNLGIILLCAPLAHAAQRGQPGQTFSQRTLHTLESLTVTDATDTFSAIVRASPAGLGNSSRHDVHQAASVNLREAMVQAADRDRVAFQYAENFVDVFAAADQIDAEAESSEITESWLTSTVYLRFLSRFNDSHIERKHGIDVARRVRIEANDLLGAMHAWRSDAGVKEQQLISLLLSADSKWKASGVNPGTSADLTVATLFFRFMAIYTNN